MSSHLLLGLIKGFFPVGLPITILIAPLLSPFWLNYLPILLVSFLNLITLTVPREMGKEEKEEEEEEEEEEEKDEVPHCGSFPPPYSRPIFNHMS